MLSVVMWPLPMSECCVPCPVLALCGALVNFALIWSTHCRAALEQGRGVNAH